MKYVSFALVVVSACANSSLHYTNPIERPTVLMPTVKVTATNSAAAFQEAMQGFDYSQALAIAEKWFATEPTSIYAALAVARASCALADLSVTEQDTDVHALRALQVLDKFKDDKTAQGSAVTLNVSPAVVWHFHYAEATGIRARWKGTGAIVLLHTIASNAELAVKAAPGYDDGAPLRLLGMLLLKAPPWPAGPGDDERGKELLEMAVRVSPLRAEGHMHRADMLLDESRVQDAALEIKRGRELAGKNPRALKLLGEVENRLKMTQGVKRY